MNQGKGIERKEIDKGYGYGTVVQGIARKEKDLLKKKQGKVIELDHVKERKKPSRVYWSIRERQIISTAQREEKEEDEDRVNEQ